MRVFARHAPLAALLLGSPLVDGERASDEGSFVLNATLLP